MRGLDARQGPTPFCGDGDGMETVKLVISYDGTDFHGFARQRGLRTVQGVLEDTLSQILKRPTEVFGSGRTDKGVHARAQVIHFAQPYGPPVDRYPFVLRRALPKDIVPLVAEAVPDSFHARFSASGKTYRYTLHTAPLEDVFTTRFVWHLPVTLNWDAMAEAAAHLVGGHDFTSFCSASTPIEDKRRTIYSITFQPRGEYQDIVVSGNGFLQYMVRIIVGTLVDVGMGRLAATQMGDILAAKDRRRAGLTAPARGLTLWQVHYPNDPGS